MKTEGGGQRGGRSQEKDGGMHGGGLESQERRLGRDHGAQGAWGGQKGVRGLSGKPTDTEEANDTDKRTGKGVFLYSELSATNMAQGPHRDHGG